MKSNELKWETKKITFESKTHKLRNRKILLVIVMGLIASIIFFLMANSI